MGYTKREEGKSFIVKALAEWMDQHQVSQDGWQIIAGWDSRISDLGSYRQRSEIPETDKADILALARLPKLCSFRQYRNTDPHLAGPSFLTSKESYQRFYIVCALHHVRTLDTL